MLRIFSFRYDEDRTRTWYFDWFGEFAARRGLVMTKNTTATQAILTPDQVDPSIIFTEPEEIERLRGEGLIPLPPDRLERLCREITIQRQVFENDSGATRATTDYAETNEFPCLSADTWLKDELELPGGFFEYEAPTAEEVKAVADEFLAVVRDG